jgi:effector-binding domain-containing protein
VKGIHVGPYDKLEATHNEINRYVEFKNLEISGAPWEVYVTDPGKESDPTKWITEIYYPVNSKEI